MQPHQKPPQPHAFPTTGSSHARACGAATPWTDDSARQASTTCQTDDAAHVPAIMSDEVDEDASEHGGAPHDGPELARGHAAAMDSSRYSVDTAAAVDDLEGVGLACSCSDDRSEQIAVDPAKHDGDCADEFADCSTDHHAHDPAGEQEWLH